MTTPSHALALLCSVALAAAPAQSLQRGRRGKRDAPAPERVTYFDGELERAQREALERNVPILILAVLEGEEANDRFAGQLRDNRTLAAKTTGAIVLIINNGTHDLEKIKERVDGEKVEREVCAQFHTPSCEVHRRNWDQVYLQYVAEGETEGRWDLPMVLIVRPNNEVAARHAHGQPISDTTIVNSVVHAQREAGHGISAVELREVRRLAEDGRIMQRVKGWSDAWRSWNGVHSITEGAGPFGLEAARELPKALEGMRVDFEAAQALLAPETVVDGYRKLHEMSTGYAGSPLEREVLRAMQKAERDPVLKPLIAPLRVELEADAIWDEGRELEQAGERRKAIKLFRRLLGRRFAETPAAQRVRESYPELVKK